MERSNKDYPIGTFAQVECLDESEVSAELLCTEEGDWAGELPICGQQHIEHLTEQRMTTRTTDRSTTVTKSEDISHSTSTILEMTAKEITQPITIDIPEQFWIEMRHYLFHGCQSVTYRSVLCKVSQTRKVSDLSHNSPKVASSVIEQQATEVLKRMIKSSHLNSLTIDSFYAILIESHAKLIPEDSFRQFLSFSIDNIVWNFPNLDSYLQLDNNELANVLVKIMSPVFNNLQSKYDLDELFSSITTPNIELFPESTTEVIEKTCSISSLPELPNGVVDIINGSPSYKCKDTFKMQGEFELTCGGDGVWVTTKTGNCQRKCGILQIPEVMKPQSKWLDLLLR